MLTGIIEPQTELTGVLLAYSGGSAQSNGYRLHGVDIGTMHLSDLQNTSTAVMTADTSTGDLIYRHYVTVNCSATGGAGSYTYAVYISENGFGSGTTVDVHDNGIAEIELSGNGYHYIWVEVGDADSMIATQRFIFDV